MTFLLLLVRIVLEGDEEGKTVQTYGSHYCTLKQYIHTLVYRQPIQLAVLHRPKSEW